MASTRAPRRGRSSAAWSAGRASLRARLPALRPGGYAVLRPPPRLVHRAGHAWEQVVLPVRAARMRALLCPANLAPVASHNAVVVIHDAAALRHPDWYSAARTRPGSAPSCR